MNATQRPLPIAVIGAGFSGTVAAIQLLRTLPPDQGVLLCERGERFGRGLAYDTANPDHLLNVRAANMSAFPDRPGHFEAWLDALSRDAADPEREGVRITEAGSFAARGLYGRYLGQLLQAQLASGGAPRLGLVQDAVSDLEPSPAGFNLRLEGGQRHAVAGAVLAMGNLAGSSRLRSRHRIDPWRPDAFGRLHPDRTVLIAGTGLTMVDAVFALRRHGFPGPIVAVSRRGLTPQVHAPATPWPLPDVSLGEARGLSALTRRIRAEIRAAEAAGQDWRGVIDALRPLVDFFWRSFPLAERGRFLRHLRPFWDSHRHRMAPPVAASIASEIARGGLTIRVGRIDAIQDEPGRALVTLRPRGGEGSAAEPVEIAAQCVIDATGLGRLSETEDPLLRRLLARGLVRPGPFDLGLDAEGHRAVGPRASGALWLLGPLLHGVLWECVAVPDIRNQAADLAVAVAASLERSSALHAGQAA